MNLSYIIYLSDYILSFKTVLFNSNFYMFKNILILILFHLSIV